MKRHAMQHPKTAAQGSGQPSTAQVINSLKLRVLQAKGGFMALGATTYMPFIEAQAAKEGVTIDTTEKLALRQVMNANVGVGDAWRVELIERALATQKAA